LDATAAFDRRAARVASLAARSGPSSLNASGTYRWSGQIESRFEATVEDLHEVARLAAASDLPLSGSAKVAGTFQGTIQAPRGRAELTARDLTAYEVAIGSVNADVTLANNRVEVDAAAPGLSGHLKGAVSLDEPYRFQAEGTLDRA